PGSAEVPRTGAGIGTGGTTSVALPFTADAPLPPTPPGTDAPPGSAAVGRSASALPGPTPGDPSSTGPPPTGGTDPSPTPAGQSDGDVSARGGVVTVRCDGRSIEVLGVAPAAGYQVEAYEPGPAREVRVELVSADNRSVVTVRCANGRPVPLVREGDS
ncbi:hypothetical protein NCC78_18540, partial [Micromonospora phytophila]|nr:hypothetical protein [Micromonospora phytophila]